MGERRGLGLASTVPHLILACLLAGLGGMFFDAATREIRQHARTGRIGPDRIHNGNNVHVCRQREGELCSAMQCGMRFTRSVVAKAAASRSSNHRADKLLQHSVLPLSLGNHA